MNPLPEITQEQLTEWMLGCDEPECLEAGLTEQQEAALLLELADPKYVSRTHGHHKTYDAGCRGILCSAAARHRGALRYRQAREQAGQVVVPRRELRVPPQIKIAKVS